MLFLRWFLSRTVRDALNLCRHVERLTHAQADLLTPRALTGLREATQRLRADLKAGSDRATLRQRMEEVEQAAQQWLLPYPHPRLRENFEVLLVALAVAMAIRTFFLQPFIIPTGSMQPTLFGVTSVNLKEHPEFQPPTGWQRVREWFAGVSYVKLIAKTDGPIQQVDPPLRLLFFNLKQTLWIGGVPHTLWFPPDCGQADIAVRGGLRPGQYFRKGDLVLHVRVQSGDHLFVDRMTYNFRTPRRGEIVVFETAGIAGLPQDQFYIKRLVALGGELVQLGPDRHVRINGRRLDHRTPGFELVYSFDPQQPPRDSQYSGHVNHPHLAPLFREHPEGIHVPPRHFMVMGDNTLNSLDSRTWGPFPARNVIGRYWFVYWPITERFGWAPR